MTATGEAVAVVGLACRYPDAPSADRLWDTVVGRRRAFRAVPPSRLGADYLGGPDDVDRTYLRQVAVLDGWQFDRRRFHIPAGVERAADPAHWLALETAAAALDDAGHPHGVGLDRSRVGVVVGNSLTGEFTRASQVRYRLPFVQREVLASLRDAGCDDTVAATVLASLHERIVQRFPAPDDETLAGALSNTIAGRLCNQFDFGGGGYTVDGACSSSLLAVATGCRALVAGELDTVVTGGVDLSLDPLELVGFARLGALASGEMRVYDADPTGFLPGEGCGMLVLMRASDARTRGLPVYAELRGWGVSSDGAGGITRPEAAGQRRALVAAYERAAVDPTDVVLVEGHGTGTATGDAVELEVLNGIRGRAFGVLGSVKANIGHTKAAAGAASLIKAVLAVHRRVLPPTTGVTAPHALLSPDVSGLRTPSDPQPWPAAPPFAAVSSMGFGGINCHIVVAGEQRRTSASAPPRAPARVPSPERHVVERRGVEVFVLGGTDRDAVAARLGVLQERARVWSHAEFVDACLTSATGWSRLAPFRVAVVASTPEELAERAGKALSRWSELRPHTTVPIVDEGGRFALGAGRPARVGLVFPGQAAPVRRALSDWARDLDVPGLDAGTPVVDGDPDTRAAQPAIVRQCLAALAWLDRAGVEAEAAVGHSLGEIAALAWAGALDAPSALRLAMRRGAAMGDLGRSGTGMAGTDAPVDAVGTLAVTHGVTVACYNGPNQVVVAGGHAQLAAFVAAARAAGHQATVLRVSHGFHSEAMRPVLEGFAAILRDTTITDPAGDVLSTVTGAVHRAGADVHDALLRQLVQPVRFAEAVAELGRRCDLLVEVGPGSTLSAAAHEITGHPVLAVDAGGRPGTAALTLAALVAAGVADPADWRGRRTHRPRTLDEVPTFLANPCEAPFLVAGTVVDPTAGVPAARPTPAPLLPAAPVGAAGSAGSAAPGGPATTAGPGRPGASGEGDALNLLRRVLAGRVELPVDDVLPTSSPLRDLHVSSLEVRRCVAEVCDTLGVVTPASTLSLSDATVAEMAAVIEAGAGAGETVDRPPAGVDTWLATFAHGWEPWPSDRPGRPDHPERTDRAPAAADEIVVCDLTGVDGARDREAAFAATLAATAVAAPRRVVIRHRGLPGAAGLARSIAVERPRHGVTLVDETAGPLVDLDPVAAVPGTHLELRTTPGGLLHSATRRWAPCAAADPVLRTGDVVLVTGGPAGITARCAAVLAARVGAVVVTVGRTDAADPAIAAAVADVRAATGADVGYQRCDVTDAADVAALSARIGPVAAVVHGAAVNRPVPIDGVTAGSLAAAWGPKVDGLGHLLDTFGAQARLVVGFGSIIGRFGLAGETDYAVANDALQTVLECWAEAHPAVRVRVLEWSVWSELGMGVRLDVLEDLRRHGVEPLRPDDGIAAFLRVVDASDAPVTLLATGRFPLGPTAHVVAGDGPDVEPGRFVGHPAVFVPGVEIVSDVALSGGDDPYLADHRIDGVEVLPAVMELEAFGQAASLLGLPHGPFAVEDLVLPSAVDVPDGREVTLRVAAQWTAGRAAADGYACVARSSSDGFVGDRARAVLRPVTDPAARTLSPFAVPADLAADDRSALYGPLAFHDGRFRRIGRYTLLTAFRLDAWLWADPDARWFSSFHPRTLRTGDPGLLDAAVHVLLPAVPGRLALPAGCGRIEVHRPPSGWVRCRAVERSHHGDEFRFDVEVHAPDGSPVLRLDDLLLRAVSDRAFADGLPVETVGAWMSRLLADVGSSAPVALAVGRGVRGDDGSDALLRTLTGCTVQRSARGAPHVADRHVSVSYLDGGHVVAGVAATPCGVDWHAVDAFADAGASVLTPADRALADVLTTRWGAGTSAHAAVAAVWTAREAARKAWGSDTVPLVPEPAAPARGGDVPRVVLRAGRGEVVVALPRVATIGTVAFAVALGGVA